jgi:hypothetical protein
VLHNVEIQRRKDVGQAQRAGAMAAAGVLEHADDILADGVGFLLQLFQCVCFGHYAYGL